MRGCSVQNSPRSCRLAHLEILISGPPSTVSSWRLTAAARRKNSSPENLTHLHYNLLGKDSSQDVRFGNACGARDDTEFSIEWLHQQFWIDRVGQGLA